MSTIRKTITVTEAQNDWIKAQIENGDYTNDSELVRDLIRRAQQEGVRIETIRKALIEGEVSGYSERTPEDIRKAVKARRAGTDAL